MTLTAFLPTGAPQLLPFIGTPGAATVGHALVWSESPQGFALAPVSVGPDQFSGVLPVSKGGWGTNTGSFTSPGAITLAAGGTNQSITLQPSGGTLNFASTENPAFGNFNCRAASGQTLGFTINFPSTSPSINNGLYVRKGLGYFAAVNATASGTGFIPTFYGANKDNNAYALGFVGFSENQTPSVAAISFSARNFDSSTGIAAGGTAFRFTNGFTGSPLYAECLQILGNGDSIFASVTESTSTTTGAVRVNGGLGVVKNVSIGGNLRVSGAINFANLPTSNTGLAVGDLWRDGDLVKVKL